VILLAAASQTLLLERIHPQITSAEHPSTLAKANIAPTSAFMKTN